MSTASIVNKQAKILPFKQPRREFPNELIPLHVMSEAREIFNESIRAGRLEEAALIASDFHLEINFTPPKKCKNVPNNLIRL